MKRFSKCVVWGFRTKFSTHTFIHHGLYKALKFMGYDAYWMDSGSPEAKHFDWPDTFVITNWDCSLELPVRDDMFVVNHGGSDHPECREKFAKLKNYLTWNVFISYSYVYDDSLPWGKRPIHRPEPIWLDDDFPFYPEQRHMEFRWATDLLPPEIEANKQGAVALNRNSKVIYHVGTNWFVNRVELSEFSRACLNGGIEFRQVGAGQDGAQYSWLGWPKVVSPEENVRLVRESYFAPAIDGGHHLTEGYFPCRVPKNLSYGRMVATNSEKVNQVFKGRLICNPNPYDLFFEARERLEHLPVEHLHSLMDYVAQHHTYVQRLECIFRAAQMVLDNAI